jgi:hypothetical protein
VAEALTYTASRSELVFFFNDANGATAALARR